MANVKKIGLGYVSTGKTMYIISRRDADSFRLNDADGTYATNPADPYLSITEDSVIKGYYEVLESRTVWNDGTYTIIAYEQVGGSPNPSVDIPAGEGIMYIKDDLEVASETLFDIADVQLASVPSTTGTLRQKLAYLFQYFRNKRTITATTETLFKEDAATTLGTSALTDDGTTVTKGETG